MRNFIEAVVGVLIWRLLRNYFIENMPDYPESLIVLFTGIAAICIVGYSRKLF